MPPTPSSSRRLEVEDGGSSSNNRRPPIWRPKPWYARESSGREPLPFDATHDPLTGIANRSRFHRRLAAVLDAVLLDGDDPARVGILLIDLDALRIVNDSRGESGGDTVLVQAAERLLDATRGSDLVARLGGDEFAVLLDGIRSPGEAEIVATRIGRALARPYAVAGHEIALTACIGVACAASALGAHPGRARAQRLAPADALLRNAELALHAAKERGAGTHLMYEPGTCDVPRARVEQASALRDALERGELTLEYQPIVDLRDGTIRGVEALARWRHPERGLVGPSEFIPFAEETGLIIPIGRWVLETATRDAAAWNRARGTVAAVSVTVNVSAHQLQDPTFVTDVERALDASGLAHDRLVLELTESVVVAQPDTVREQLTALKQRGVRLALDDFGTGYSALRYLQQLPFDVLKIDRCFIAPLDGVDGPSAALTSAIVSLGGALSLNTVAEGIETPAQRDALAAMGCTLGQGFLFGRSMPAAEIVTLLSPGDDQAE